MGTDTIYNVIKVNDLITTAGQPTEQQLQEAAAEGFITVISLVPLDNRTALANEGDIVRGLGMNYYHLPVIWGNPTEADFDAFDKVMTARPNDKTLIHCAANFRVTAFYSLYAQKRLGWSAAQAAEFRAQIWNGSHYPIWEAYLAEMSAKLDSNF